MASHELASIRLELLKGDSKFLGQQYTEHRSGCIQLLKSKYYCDEIEAEDIFTEAILVLRKKIIDQKLDNLKNIRSYLLSTVAFLKKESNTKKERSAKTIDHVRILFSEHGYIEEIENEEYTEQLKRICSLALRTLSEKCEQILRLYYQEGMSMQDIALLVGLSSGNVAKASKARCYKQWIAEANKLKQNME